MKRLLFLPILFAVGCSFSPKPQPPVVAAPTAFKQGSIEWKTARPADHEPRGNWWEVFKDPALDALLEKVASSNQSLEAAVARADQAAAMLVSTRLAFLPTLNANASITKSKSGAFGGSSYNDSTGSGGGASAVPRNIQSVTINSSWEIDLWGRMRHAAKAATANYEASESDATALLLSLQANAARTYFLFRAAGAEEKSLKGQAESQATSLEITRNREAAGQASRSDVALAETQLATTQAAMQEAVLRRATLENALALLAGCAPADFSVPSGQLTTRVPRVPAAVPSTLLERRPDIAAAERRVAAANERVGVARAAFFPTLTLTGNTGWRALADGGLAALITSANNFWALGAQGALAVLNSGQRIAAKRQAEASWREMVADYRQTALNGFRETEDALATLRILAAESRNQEEAVRASQESVRIASNQYKAGTLNYLNVVIAQTAALNAERAAIDVQARRLTATVDLIAALGGGWREVSPCPEKLAQRQE